MTKPAWGFLCVVLVLVSLPIIKIAMRPDSGVVVDLIHQAEQRWPEMRSECVMMNTEFQCIIWDYYTQERIAHEAFKVVTEPKPNDRFAVWVSESVFRNLAVDDEIYFDEVNASYQRTLSWGKVL